MTNIKSSRSHETIALFRRRLMTASWKKVVHISMQRNKRGKQQSKNQNWEKWSEAWLEVKLSQNITILFTGEKGRRTTNEGSWKKFSTTTFLVGCCSQKSECLLGRLVYPGRPMQHQPRKAANLDNMSEEICGYGEQLAKALIVRFIWHTARGSGETPQNGRAAKLNQNKTKT